MINNLTFRSHQIQAEILRAVLSSVTGKISLSDIEKITGLERESVKKSISELRESGIEIVGKKSLSLSELPDSIFPPVILCGLKSRVMGRRIMAYKSIGSTNNTARRLAESGSPDGTVIISERQTKGRGRLGRSWYSPSGKGLYFSIVLRPEISVAKMPALSLVAALSICRAVEKATGLAPKVKWPNDCLIGDKKIAGILVDVSAELDSVSYAVLGVGININADKKDFPANLRKTASSLAVEADRKFHRVEILQSFLYEFEKSYNNFCRYGLRFIGPELVKKSSVINKEIGFKLGKKKFTGIALGYDENGGLRVKLKDGVTTLRAGEITLRK